MDGTIKGTIREEGPICGVGVREGWADGHTLLCPLPKNGVHASSRGKHVQLFRMVYDRKKGFRAKLRIFHCLCQHGCKREIFMFPRVSCVCMHLEMWAEVKVHSHHAHAHMCASGGMCCAQATLLCKVQ